MLFIVTANVKGKPREIMIEADHIEHSIEIMQNNGYTVTASRSINSKEGKQSVFLDQESD